MMSQGNPGRLRQMGLTHPAWRLHVRKGDRLAFNGVYDSSRFAYPDAMNYFGLYIDRDDATTKSEACKVELIGRPNASREEVTHTIPNQEWPSHHPMPTCRNCNDKGPTPQAGPPNQYGPHRRVPIPSGQPRPRGAAPRSSSREER